MSGVSTTSRYPTTTPPQKWPHWVFGPKRCAMFWNLWKKNLWAPLELKILWRFFFAQILVKITQSSFPRFQTFSEFFEQFEKKGFFLMNDLRPPHPSKRADGKIFLCIRFRRFWGEEKNKSTIFFFQNFLYISFFVLKSSETYAKKILPSALFEGGGVCRLSARTRKKLQTLEILL